MMKKADTAEKVTTGYVIKSVWRVRDRSGHSYIKSVCINGRPQDWTRDRKDAKVFVNHADAELTLGLIGAVSLIDDIKIVKRFAWK